MPNDLSTFDPDTFLSTEFSEPNETRFQPIPTMDCEASVDNIKVRVAKESTIMDVWWLLHDEVLAERLGRDRLVCRQSVFLDIENGVIALGPNKNVQLGRLRKALGQNEGGRPWSPRMLEGAGPALVHVEQDPNGEYPSEVKRAAPLA